MRRWFLVSLVCLMCLSVNAQVPNHLMVGLQRAARHSAAMSAVPVGTVYPVFENAMMTSSNITESGLTNTVYVYESSYYDANSQGWRAFMGKTDVVRYWNSASAVPPHWIEYDCGAGNSNVAIELSTSGYASYGYKVFNLHGSMDRTNYTLLITNSAPNVVGQRWVVSEPAYYRYYKFTFLSGWTDNYARLYVLELSSADFVSPVMTATNAPSPYVITSDSADPAYPSLNAFDGNIASTFQTVSGSNYPHWVKMDFGSNVVINGFTYAGYGAYSLNFKSYTLEGSTDDTNYTVLDSGTFTTGGGYQLKTNHNTSAYRYYKLNSTNGYTSTLGTVRELTLKHYK